MFTFVLLVINYQARYMKLSYSIIIRINLLDSGVGYIWLAQVDGIRPYKPWYSLH